MASGMCIQLRRVFDKRLPPDFSLGYARTLLANVPSYRRLRFIRCESRRTGLSSLPALAGKMPACLTGVMAVFTTLRRQARRSGPEVERDRCNYRYNASGQAPHLGAGRLLF